MFTIPIPDHHFKNGHSNTGTLLIRYLNVSGIPMLGIRVPAVFNNQSPYYQLHIQEKRATPMNFAKYKLAVQLHRIYNRMDDNDDWLDMNDQQSFNARNTNFHINDSSRTKVGRNIICNRLTCLNGEIKLDWLNLTPLAFKLKAKSIFLTKGLT